MITKRCNTITHTMQPLLPQPPHSTATPSLLPLQHITPIRYTHLSLSSSFIPFAYTCKDHLDNCSDTKPLGLFGAYRLYEISLGTST